MCIAGCDGSNFAENDIRAHGQSVSIFSTRQPLGNKSLKFITVSRKAKINTT